MVALGRTHAKRKKLTAPRNKVDVGRRDAKMTPGALEALFVAMMVLYHFQNTGGCLVIRHLLTNAREI